MEPIKALVKLEFKKVKFVSSTNNRGRCVKCEAKEYCGSKFTCPCKMDEQLVIFNTETLTL